MKEYISTIAIVSPSGCLNNLLDNDLYQERYNHIYQVKYRDCLICWNENYRKSKSCFDPFIVVISEPKETEDDILRSTELGFDGLIDIISVRNGKYSCPQDMADISNIITEFTKKHII